jgi:hypothetical protein
MGSGVLCASGWTGSGNYGEWNVSGYAAYSVVVQDSAVTMTSQLITVPSRVTWTLLAEEL